jgi:SAM-dependent methyltransferase
MEIKVDTKSLDDEYGYSTLDTLSSADNFNRWMYSVIAPHCTGEILEIGGGIGNISVQFLAEGKDLTVTELQEKYCNIIRQKLSGYKGLKEVIRMDITDPGFDDRHAGLMGKFDTVFALNVIEHIPDRYLALSNCRKLLKPGGKLIILVPAFQSLFNRFDESLGHYLRFTRSSLDRIMEEGGFTVLNSRYFNFIGIFGWWLSGSVLKKKMIPEGQMAIYNRLVPVFRMIDIFMPKIAGLSVISVGVKEKSVRN